MNNLHGTQNDRVTALRDSLLVAMDYIVFCYQNINEQNSKSNCERSYKYEYQPFAGLIAFVNAETDMKEHHKKINTALSKRKDIATVQTLQTFTIRAGFEYSYQSIHKHRLKHNMDLYHIFLDYSDIITS